MPISRGLSSSVGRLIAALLLAVVIIASRVPEVPAPVASQKPPPSDWLRPSPFDIVKEQNAHAGRLATLLGIVLAAISVTLANGPVHDAIVKPSSAHGLLYFALFALAVGLFDGAITVGQAMEPPVTSHIANDEAWATLVERKRNRSLEASFDVVLCLAALVAVWASAFTDTGPYWPIGLLSIVGPIILLLLRVFRPLLGGRRNPL
jgi:hypothetical protein